MNMLTTWQIDELPSRLPGFIGLLSSDPADAFESMPFIGWMPSVDISEDEKEWCLNADLPDVKKEDVSITVENGVLLLAGERKFEKTERRRKYYCMECARGTFARSFRLPEGADGCGAAAEHTNGVLTVHVPKNRKITPKAAGAKTG